MPFSTPAIYDKRTQISTAIFRSLMEGRTVHISGESPTNVKNEGHAFAIYANRFGHSWHYVDGLPIAFLLAPSTDHARALGTADLENLPT